MPHDDQVYLGHILDTADLITKKLEGVTRSDFEANDTLQLAIAFLLQRIGEAARRVSSQQKETISEIPWHQVIGLRNRVVHDYININFRVIWLTATESVPDLARVLRPLVEPIDED